MSIDDRVYRAKQLRYKRAALEMLQWDRLYDELYDISSECADLEWAVQDDEKLLDVFDGDTDEIYDFRISFADLSAKCEQLQCAIREENVTEHFDDFFVGALANAYNAVGYDSYQEDYYSLTRFTAELAQTESGKRLQRLTKNELISIAGQCIGVMVSFLDIRHSHDNLKTALDSLRDERAEMLASVRGVEEAWDALQDDWHNRKASEHFDRLLSYLPDRLWVE